MSTLAASGPLDEKSPPSVTTADEEKTMENNPAPGDTEATLTSTAPSPSRDPGASSNGEHKGTKSAAETKSTSPSSPNTAVATASRQASHRKSGWKSFIAKLVPCIGPSKAHPIEELEERKPKRESTSSETPAPVADAAQPEIEPVREAPASSPPTAEPAAPSAPSTPTRPDPLTTSSAVQTDLEPPATESEVIVPPSPTHHLLPTSETGGLTSGAVQPPGSTGREEEDESLAANTEDDGEQQDGAEGTVPEEEDEDAIVLRGGLGIPIVVCGDCSLCIEQNAYLSLVRTASNALCFLHWHLSTKGENA